MKAFKAAITFLMLVLLLVEVQPLIVNANFHPSPPYIEIISPRENGYTTGEFLLNITVKVYYDSSSGWQRRSLVYSLDGGEHKLMNSSYQGVFYSSVIPYSLVTGQATVSDVSDGVHSLTVYVKYNETYSSTSQTVRFTAGSPTVTINVSGDTQAFEENSAIPYSINVSTPYAWYINNEVFGKLFSVGYLLDNNGGFVVADELSISCLSADKQSLLFTGNLSEVPNGNHALTAFVTWAYPKDANPKTTSSETTIFSVGTQPAQPSYPINLFTVTVISGLIVTFMVAFVFLRVYRRNRQKHVAYII